MLKEQMGSFSGWHEPCEVFLQNPVSLASGASREATRFSQIRLCDFRRGRQPADSHDVAAGLLARIAVMSKPFLHQPPIKYEQFGTVDGACAMAAAGFRLTREQ
jgi:hypothetical protein